MLKYVLVGLIIFLVYKFMTPPQPTIQRPDHQDQLNNDDEEYTAYEELDD